MGTATETVRLRRVTLRELEGFASDALEGLRPGDVVPTTPSRARAQAANPDADEGDVGLIVATQGDRCVGFLGSLPGKVKVHGRFEKVNWLSTWYVAPEWRKTMVGASLLLSALALGSHTAATGFSEQSGRMFQGLRFQPLGPLRYLVADLARFNLPSLPFRALRRAAVNRGRRRTPVLDRLVDAAGWWLKAPLYALLGAATRPLRRPYTTRRVTRLDDTSFESARDQDAPVRFFRGRDTVNWMLRERWLVTDPGQATPGYEFSDYDPLFDLVALEVRGASDGTYRGFVVLRVDSQYGRRSVTVHDHFFADPADRRVLLPLAVEQGRSVLADRIVLPEECVPAVNASPLVRWLFRTAERRYYCRTAGNDSALAAHLGEITLDLSDCDIPFA
jgi:hypothetical protein